MSRARCKVDRGRRWPQELTIALALCFGIVANGVAQMVVSGVARAEGLPSEARSIEEVLPTRAQAQEPTRAQVATLNGNDDDILTDFIRSSAAADDDAPITMRQFKAFLMNYRRVQERMGRVENKVGSLSPRPDQTLSAEEAVDLNTMGSAGVGTPPVRTSGSQAHGAHADTMGVVPGFKVYFDLNLIARPNIENLSFDTYHSFLFFEIMPTSTVTFSFDVNPSPRYYELDYQVLPKLQLRMGKIWIPFDDMSPHNIFGGRVNVSRLTAETSAPAFLPDLWTDLGVGFKFDAFDVPLFSLDVYGYIVNGFREGGKDPVTPGSPYPSFNDLPTALDNNRDKSFGGRVHAQIYRMFGLGLSYYNGRWNNDTGNVSGPLMEKRLSILGIDGQYRFRNFEVRVGYASMAIDLPTADNYSRGGAYGELGVRFGAQREWKGLLRAGLTQLDDRVTDTNPAVALGDATIVGATLLWKPELIQYSLGYSRDFAISPAKVNYSYFAGRVVMAF